jgi:hypothetical protein
MLYMVFHIIPKKERDKLLLEFLEPEVFYKFMFHWSIFVRMAFHSLYYFQLHRMLIEDDNIEDMQSSISGAVEFMIAEKQAQEKSDLKAGKLQEVPQLVTMIE